MIAADEIAALTKRVQELEADLQQANADAEMWERDYLTVCADLEEAQWAASQMKSTAEFIESTAEFIEDVRRGIRDLSEYEAVCA